MVDYISYPPVAQLVEQLPFKETVVGSSPTGGTDKLHMKIILALDSIRSTHNVGSLFRTSDACGVDEIILGGITPGPIDRFGRPRPDVAKVALGAELTIPWKACENLMDYLNDARSNGVRIIALEQSDRSVSLFDEIEKKDIDTILVVGNEVDGVSPEILALADTVWEIPQLGAKESLNVSVAGGVALYHLTKISGRLDTI